MSQLTRTPGNRVRLHRIDIDSLPSGRYRWRVCNLADEPLSIGVCRRRGEAQAQARAFLNSLPKLQGSRSHMGTVNSHGPKLNLRLLRMTSYG